MKLYKYIFSGVDFISVAADANALIAWILCVFFTVYNDQIHMVMKKKAIIDVIGLTIKLRFGLNNILFNFFTTIFVKI